MAIDYSIIINNIKNHLLLQTWVSASTGGTTSFQAGFSFPNIENADGSPFFIIDDKNSNGEGSSNKGIKYTTSISIAIYVNWSNVTGIVNDLKREEAMIRLREAVNFVRGYVSLDIRRSDWGFSSDAFHTNFNIISIPVGQLNLFGKIITFDILDFPLRI